MRLLGGQINASVSVTTALRSSEATGAKEYPYSLSKRSSTYCGNSMPFAASVTMFASKRARAQTKRMNRSAVFKIAADDNRQTLQFALFLFQGVQVAEGLGRVLVSPVAGIDHGNIGIFGHRLNRAVPVMAYDQHVSVTGNDLGGVGDRFSFGGR